MEMLALLGHPMSNMRLFLNEKPQTTLQFEISPRVHKIPPLKKLLGSLEFYSLQVRVQSTQSVRVKCVINLSIKKEPDHWLHN